MKLCVRLAAEKLALAASSRSSMAGFTGPLAIESAVSHYAGVNVKVSEQSCAIPETFSDSNCIIAADTHLRDDRARHRREVIVHASCAPGVTSVVTGDDMCSAIIHFLGIRRALPHPRLASECEAVDERDLPTPLTILYPLEYDALHPHTLRLGGVTPSHVASSLGRHALHDALLENVPREDRETRGEESIREGTDEGVHDSALRLAREVE